MPKLGVAGLNAAAFQVDLRALRAVEGGVEVEALQAIVLETPVAGPCRSSLPCGAFRRAGDVDLTIDLPAQLRPQLGQARQLDVDLPGQFLLQAALAVDAVVAEADLQGIQVPLLASAVGLGLRASPVGRAVCP